MAALEESLAAVKSEESDSKKPARKPSKPKSPRQEDVLEPIAKQGQGSK